MKLLLLVCFIAIIPTGDVHPQRRTNTTVSIKGDKFLIDGRLTYKGRTWQGYPIQGLLMNARMVQGIFDDQNPVTAEQWKYPDTQRWDPDRNTNEFIRSMDAWRAKGLLAFSTLR